MICQDIITMKGADSKYTKDCQVRAIRGKSLSEAIALLGWTAPLPIVIQAGIGTLVLGPGGEDFTPAPTKGGMAKSWIASLADRSPASAERMAARQSICSSCDLRDANADSCRACGCGLKAKLALAAQKCPKGKW